MNKKITLEMLKKEVKRINGNENPTALMLLASLVVGPNIKRIASFTKLPRNFVATKARRFRENRIWVGKQVNAGEWFNKKEGGSVVFMCDTLIGDGLLQRSKAS